MDRSTIFVTLIMGLSNTGAVCAMLKWYARRVDKNDEESRQHAILLGQIAENQKATSETLARINKESAEHYGSINSHTTKLAEIMTLHEVKGCMRGHV